MVHWPLFIAQESDQSTFTDQDLSFSLFINIIFTSLLESFYATLQLYQLSFDCIPQEGFKQKIQGSGKLLLLTLLPTKVSSRNSKLENKKNITPKYTQCTFYPQLILLMFYGTDVNVLCYWGYCSV